ncbi:zinc-binding dehydrogenase [Parapedobacter indicus]|uniref:NADPH:quinone reductase n=1 Tax=Parapedobacter indicus TaxID=1477437 RepID=A0A1I3NGP7_9SPHI|nr:zinc-binding dehydrogenase [Parapedobacter indicus]PPL00978.1 NADPH:quinone reductase-like Zn-dependent oxidoreductase [Parapedobacter indicus]SFJ08337.1 NADPH:quinone reductase [Parapedobacter indicus]
MKAIVLHGEKEPLVLQDVPAPQLGNREALIRVKAAAFNRRDWWIQQGQYAGLKFPIILGSDGAGIVEAVGAGADNAWIGKAVIINPSIEWGAHEGFQQKTSSILGLPQDGTFAEYVRVPVENLHEKPRHLSFEEAAALPLGGLTAYRSLFSRANLVAGEKVLIVGIGGGVASFALQWALHVDAEVYVTSGSPIKIEQAIALGAKGGVLYTDENWSQQLREDAGGFDVIVDSALGDGFAHHLDLANPGGRIVFFGGTAGNIPPLNARKIFWKQLSILGSTMGSPRDFSHMLRFVNDHRIKPMVDSVYPLEDAEAAIRNMDNSSQFGKIVLSLESLHS